VNPIADVALAARLLLAAVFGVAGVAKLADRRGAREAVLALGAPPALVVPVAAGLPLMELAVAGALLISPTALAGAAGALALLAVFVAGIARSLARGRQPDCRCFGQVHSAPVTWKTLVRNLILTAVAILVAIGGPGTGLSAWASGMSAVAWITLAVAAVLAVAFAVEGTLLLDRWRSRR
jgi:hypothetical protein